MIEQIEIRTAARCEFQDISSSIQELVKGSGIEDGSVLLFVPHTTAAVTINENADPDVASDILAGLSKLVPFEDNYRHREGNSAAHIKSSLVGASETLLIKNGRLQLGTWQGIYFCEFDGPRSRRLLVKITPDLTQ
jgi:secondary thiamine-phosphate synthase enzyme